MKTSAAIRVLRAVLVTVPILGSATGLLYGGESGAENEPTLEIRPADSVGAVLDIEMDGARIEVFRIDFAGRGVDKIEVKVVAVQRGMVTELGFIDVPMPESGKRTVSGTAYIAMSIGKDEDRIPVHVVTVGLTTETSRRHSRCKELSSDVALRRTATAQRSKEARLAVGVEHVIWAVRLLPKSNWQVPKSVDEILKEGAFESLDLEDIVKRIGATKDMAAIVACIKAVASKTE
jgi:hypothetical protein